MIAETAQRGFAIRSEGEFNRKTASIAVPIVRQEVVFGCISIIWVRSALSLDEAAANFVTPLREAAAMIPVSD